MSRFDRYLLSQQVAVFGFFSLVLVLVYWVNRAVGLFDQLIGDGQSALVFLEFSLLTLPFVIKIVLPVSAFAATVYVTNRLTQDGELVVMQATGFSAFRLARPVFYFGMLVVVTLVLLSHFAVPASRATLAQRTAEVAASLTSQLLSDGRFMHPAEGVTFYIREVSPKGELLDVFISDDRAKGSRTAYSAQRALLVRGETGPKIVMFEGLSQTIDRATGRLSVTHFADFTYGLGTLDPRVRRPGSTLDELSTFSLLFPTEAEIATARSSRAAFRTEAHDRFAQPFLGLGAALIGFASLLLGAFSRFGLWRQILGAIVLLILVQMVNNAATSQALRNEGMWWMTYAAPILSVAIGIGLLALSQRSRRRPRAMAEVAA